jgi:hypothetical protein
LAPDADLGALQSAAAELQAQLAGLQAQWNGLKSQLDNMLRSNPARPAVVQQWADVGVQIATTEGRLASVQARINLKQGRPVGTTNVPVFGRLYFPPSAIPAISVVSLALLLPMSIAFAKRMMRQPQRPAAMPNEMTTRLDRMEHAIDTIAIEVERISEGQRFVTKLMADRATNAQADRSATEPPQEKQPLALGAGPMEPIVVGQRDQVRQRIVTPH